MKTFLQRFASLVLSTLIGFDRWRFRGSKRMLCYPDGVMSFLSRHSILLKEFNQPYAKAMTDRLCAALEKPAVEAGIYRFLNSSKISKEQTALAIAQEHGKTQGLIAVLGCTEPCQNLRVRKNHQTKKLEVRVEPGKCLHYYHYYVDAEFGLRTTRLQSWFPFTMHMGLNGRDWLEHFKVFRTKEGDEDGPLSYRRLRKGVADLHRRAEVSEKINDRYLASLATVEEKQTLAEVTKGLGQRVEWKGRMCRALNPLAPEDAALFEAVSRGGFMIDGFSNR